jgi:hypothetical protein
MDWVGILMSVSAACWHGGPMMMIGGTGRRPGETWTGGSVVAGGVLLALLTMAYVHVAAVGVVDPLEQTISDYVAIPGGYLLLALAAVALAVAGIALAAGLRPAGLPDAGPPATLLMSGSAALLLVAVFPTNAPGTPAGVVANIHRVAGGWVFAALPLAAWLVARRARNAPGWGAMVPTLTWCAGVTGLLSAGFLLSHVPIVIGTSSGFPLLGGVERVLYAAMMVVLLVTARATWLAVTDARARRAAPEGVVLGATALPTDIGRVA